MNIHFIHKKSIGSVLNKALNHAMSFFAYNLLPKAIEYYYQKAEKLTPKSCDDAIQLRQKTNNVDWRLES